MLTKGVLTSGKKQNQSRRRAREAKAVRLLLVAGVTGRGRVRVDRVRVIEALHLLTRFL